jgi:tetratricopeptide (TPR) repeat protein
VDGGDLVALGRTYLAAGLHEQAIEVLQRAAVDRDSQYDAALALAELHEWRGEGALIAEWLEQAAASAPSPVKRGAVLYRLGLALEQLGRPARALVVLKELESMAPGFRDVRARIARLEATPPGGGPSLR